MTAADTTYAPDDLAGDAPLSLNQEFLRAFDAGDADGAFGHRHLLVAAWRITGAIDVPTLRLALRDVVERHEVLRTEISRVPGEHHQTVHPVTAPELEVRDLPAGGSRDERAEELLNELDSTPFGVGVLPHLRAVLGRFDERDAVLVIVTHHTASDAWSLQLLVRDVANRYAARRGQDVPELPVVHQYREFAREQQDVATEPAVVAALDYWRDALEGARLAALPTDRPARTDVPSAYGVHRFVVDPELSAATLRFARSSRCSGFMVLLAAVNVLFRRRTGVVDVVVPTFTSGRYDERFTDTVGPFFNFCALRTDTTGATRFRDVLLRTREACLGAYAHDVPFALVAGTNPELTAPFADGDSAVVAFEVLQSPAELDGQLIGDLTFSDLRRRVISQPVSSGIPNGGLWAMDVLPSGEICGSFKYDANRFDLDTVTGIVGEYLDVLRSGVAAADTPLAGW